MPSRVDNCQAEIVAALRAAGCSVVDLHNVRHGCPDIAVGRTGITFFLECKSDHGALTPDEQRFVELWRGHYAIVRSVEEALRAGGLLT